MKKIRNNRTRRNHIFCFKGIVLYICLSILILAYIISTINRTNEAKNDIQYFELKGNNQSDNEDDEHLPTKMFSHLDMVDPSSSLRSMRFTSLDLAHRQGKIHMGAWIHVVDSLFIHHNTNTNTNTKVLLLKRSKELVTCPNTWSLVGEHTYRDETPLETVQRAIQEELGRDMFSYLQKNGRITALTDFPIYYERDYGVSNGGRIDRQLTYLWLVEMNLNLNSNSDVDTGDVNMNANINANAYANVMVLDDLLQLDNEVAEHRWISLQEYSDLIEKDFDRENKLFCHDTIVSLTQLAINKIMELRKKTA